MARIDANIIIDTPHVEPGDDLMLFAAFGSTELNEEVKHLPESTTWGDILVHFGIFQSKGQARKAGWDKISTGWHEIEIGKLRHRFWLWKPGSAP